MVRRCKEAEGQTRWKRPCVNGLGDKTLLFTGLEYMPLLKGGPKRWKWTEIMLKSDKLIVNVVVFKLCNCISVFLKSKGEGIAYLLTLVYKCYIACQIIRDNNWSYNNYVKNYLSCFYKFLIYWSVFFKTLMNYTVNNLLGLLSKYWNCSFTFTYIFKISRMIGNTDERANIAGCWSLFHWEYNKCFFKKVIKSDIIHNKKNAIYTGIGK